jgi:WD40 repeat protein
LLPNGRNLAWVADTASGAVRFPLSDEKGGVTDVVFSPNGDRVATALSNKVLVRDAATGAEVRTIPTSAAGIDFHPDGKRLATIGQGEWRLWDAGTGELIRPTPLDNTGGGVTFTPDGERVVTIRPGVTSNTAVIQFWDVSTGAELLALTAEGNLGPSKRLSFGAGGRYLLAHGLLGPTLIWDGGPATPEQRLAWLRYRSRQWSVDAARMAERDRDWFAARWHLERLVALDPADTKLAGRLQKAKAALAEPPKP